MDQFLNGCLAYILKLKQQLQKFSLCWILILPLQTFFLIILSIQYNLSSNPNDCVAIVFTKIYTQLTSALINQICLIVGFFTSILLICLFIIFLKLKKPNNELDKYAIWLNKLIIISAFLVYIFELILIQIVWNFKVELFNILYQRPNTNNVFILLVCMLATVFVGVLNHRFRVFGCQIILFILIIENSEGFSLASAFIGTGIGIYSIQFDQDHEFLMIKEHNTRKIIHFLLTIFYLWKIMEYAVNGDTKPSDLYISYIYLACMFLLVIIIGFLKFMYKIDKKPSLVIQLCETLKKLEKQPKNIQSKLYLFQIVSEYFKILEKQKQINVYFYQLRMKKSKEWTTEDWHFLVNVMIKQEYQKEPSLQSGINMLKCRLMIRDKKIFEIIQLLKDVISMDKQKKLTNKYQILKIALKIQQTYFKKYQSGYHPIVHLIREVDKLNQHFYSECCNAVTLLYQFWVHVVAYKISIDEHVQGIPISVFVPQNQQDKLQKRSQHQMQKLIVKMFSKIEQLQSILKEIEVISVAKREARALNCIKFLTTYSQEHHDDMNSSKLDSDKNNILSSSLNSQKDFSEYLQIMDSKITKISLKLATELGYRKLQLFGESLGFLMPKQYELDIEKEILGHKQPFLQIPYLVPIICSDSSIILKSVNSHLELDCESGYRMVFHMNSTMINDDPILIYNTAHNIIEYYNTAFISTFKINKNKIDNKIRNQFLNPDQIFKDLPLSEKSIQAKLAEGGLQSQYNCRIHIQEISQKKASKLEHIRLSLIEQYKDYMILKVMKGYRTKSVMGEDQNLTGKVEPFSTFTYIKNDTSNPMQKTTKLKGKETAILCKIQNPYEGKINAKKLEISKKRKLTLKFFAVLCLLLAILSLVIEGISFIKVNSQISNAVSMQSTKNLNSISQYMELMLAYQSHYKYALLTLNKEAIENMGIDYQKQLTETSNLIQTQIKSFQKEYLQSLGNEPQNGIEFGIQFKYFNITTDSSTTNLFDFSQNILLYGQQDALHFLFVNYPIFASLANKIIDKLQSVQNELTGFINIQYIVSGVISVISLIFLIISTIFNFKIAAVWQDINTIFKLIHRSSMQIIFNSLSCVKKKFLQIGSSDSNLQKKYQNTIDAYLKLDGINLSQTQQLKSDTGLLGQVIEKQEDIKVESQKLISNDPAKAQQRETQTKKTTCWAMWGYICFFIGLIIINIVQISYFQNKVGIENAILSFKIQNKLISQHLISHILQTQHHILSKMMRNESYNIQTGREVWLINNQKLPSEYFQSYSQQYFSKVSGDLCHSLKDKTLINFDHNQCDLIGMNQFVYGIPIAIQQIQEILITSKNQNPSFWFNRFENHTFALYQQIFMAQELIIAINHQNEQDLISYINDFRHQMSIKVFLIFLLSCSTCIGLLIFLFKIKFQIYRISIIGVGYFLIMPKKILLESQVLHHIRQKQLLNRIGYI